ncbi:MAG: hypothetical protein IKP72_15455, partial [Clostridia bacterium]|nr:hypothetical protein [Clostridia bacterium]
MREKSGRRRPQPGRAMLAAVMLFFFLGFFLLALNDGERTDHRGRKDPDGLPAVSGRPEAQRGGSGLSL